MDISISTEDLAQAIAEVARDGSINLNELLDIDDLVETLYMNSTWGQHVQREIETRIPDAESLDLGGWAVQWTMDQLRSMPSTSGGRCDLGKAFEYAVAMILLSALRGEMDERYDNLGDELKRWRNSDIELRVTGAAETPGGYSLIWKTPRGTLYSYGPFVDGDAAAAYRERVVRDGGFNIGETEIVKQNAPRLND